MTAPQPCIYGDSANEAGPFYTATPARVVAQVKSNRPWAAVLSFLVPGLGYIMKGRVGLGLFWLVCVTIGYFCLIIPGIILHSMCVFLSADLDKQDVSAN